MKRTSGFFWLLPLFLAAITLGSCSKNVSSYDAPISTNTVSTYDVSSASQLGVNEVIGDFEMPWTEQWSHVVGKNISQQFLIGNRSQIPVRQGSYAARFIVRPGDQEISRTTGERCEVGHFNDVRHGYTQEKPNDEFYYGWSTYIPGDWKTPSGWCVMAQWHARAGTIPPIAMYIGSDNSIGINLYTGLVKMPISWYLNYAYRAGFPVVKSFAKNAWHDFIVRIRFTPNNEGIIQVWHKMQSEKNWVLALSKTNIPTMQMFRAQDWPAIDIDNASLAPDNRIPWGSYVTTQLWPRLGLYRGPSSFTNVIYHDNWARAKSWSEIASNFL